MKFDDFLAAERGRAYVKYIGIDTGVNTGVAIWNKPKKKFDMVKKMMIHQAMEIVAQQAQRDHVCVYVEDARQRKWFNDAGKSWKERKDKLQGAGSVKRDCKIWEDFLTDKGIPFKLIAPKNNTTKLDADSFKAITGYKERTCEHSRDAAMMVYGI